MPFSGAGRSQERWDEAWTDEARRQCRLLKDLLGPFPYRHMVFGTPIPIDPGLARRAYEERVLPSGHLATDRLAVLSDALEEAGCTDEAILAHLRSPGPHVRGCWALDLVLGKK